MYTQRAREKPATRKGQTMYKYLNMWHNEDGTYTVQVSTDNGAIETYNFGQRRDAKALLLKLQDKYGVVGTIED